MKDVEIIEAIRETLHYIEAYLEQLIVIILEHDIVSNAEQLGITKDIKQLHDVGIPLVVIHNYAGLDQKKWISVQEITSVSAHDDLMTITSNIRAAKIPVIYCGQSGSLFSNPEVAKLASELGGKKLCFVTNKDGIYFKKQLIRELTTVDALELLDIKDSVTSGMRMKLIAAVHACNMGIERVHIINGLRQSALLRELLSCEGIGTMIYKDTNQYKLIRKAKPSEISDIVDVLLCAQMLATVDAEEIAAKILNFWVFAVDAQVHGCVMVSEQTSLRVTEISYLATSNRYDTNDTLHDLFNFAVEIGKQSSSHTIIVPVNKNTMWLSLYPWVNELGFQKKVLDYSWHSFAGKNWIMMKNAKCL